MNYKTETPEETENFDDANFKEENRLEELFKLLNITNYNFSPRSGNNAFEGYDATFITKGEEYIIEAKVRNYKLEAFDNHPLLEHKAATLAAHWKEGKTVLYIQFFNDGAIIYHLSNRFHLLNAGKDAHQLVAETKLMDNNTAKDRGKSFKQVYNLSPEPFLRDKILPYKPNPIFFLNKKLLK
jgi:hypothetical protein